MTILKNIFKLVIGLEIIVALAMLIGLLGMLTAEVGVEAAWKVMDLQDIYGPEVWEQLDQIKKQNDWW